MENPTFPQPITKAFSVTDARANPETSKCAAAKLNMAVFCHHRIVRNRKKKRRRQPHTKPSHIIRSFGRFVPPTETETAEVDRDTTSLLFFLLACDKIYTSPSLSSRRVSLSFANRMYSTSSSRANTGVTAIESD